MSDQERLLDEATKRVRKVAEGGTINGTYRKMPMASLQAFRDDLLTLIAAIRTGERG